MGSEVTGVVTGVVDVWGIFWMTYTTAVLSAAVTVQAAETVVLAVKTAVEVWWQG